MPAVKDRPQSRYLEFFSRKCSASYIGKEKAGIKVKEYWEISPSRHRQLTSLGDTPYSGMNLKGQVSNEYRSRSFYPVDTEARPLIENVHFQLMKPQ